MTYDDDHYLLSSGREFYAHRGILGLSPEDPGDVYEGYDGLAVMRDDIEIANERAPLTPPEKQEVAEYMITQWKAWAGMSEP